MNTGEKTRKSIDRVNVCSIGVVNESCIIAVGTCLPMNPATLKPGELLVPRPKADAEKIMICVYLIFRHGSIIDLSAMCLCRL